MLLHLLVCESRNGSYCITGSVRLHVYEHSSVNMDKLSHKVPVTVGERLTLRCPSLGDFWNTDSHIEWDKVRGNTGVHQSVNLRTNGIKKGSF